MPPLKGPNKSITDFFKPKQTNSDPPSSAGSQSLPPPSHLPVHNHCMGSSTSRVAERHDSCKSSSLSPPPSSDASDRFHTPREHPENDTPITGGSTSTPQKLLIESKKPRDDLQSSSPSPPEDEAPAPMMPRSRDAVINDSDDDSDDSLKDLSTLFGRKPLASKPSNSPAKPPSTPQMSRYRNAGDFHSSPLTVQPKYKFDLQTLAKHSKDEDSLAISSKRVKSMLEPANGQDITMVSGPTFKNGISTCDALIASVVADDDSGEAYKLKRALLRTEAVVQDECWYFFETTSDTVELPDNNFPIESIAETWEDELLDPDMRELSFTSGFVEDLVVLGKTLPDELFMWMLDELCWESSDVMRNSYMNVLLQSDAHVHRRLTPEVVQKLFRNLGGEEEGVAITTTIQLVNKVENPYPDCQWECLQSVVRFLGKVAHIVEQDTRIYILIMLLRMSADQVVHQNLDIHVEVQATIRLLCRYSSEESPISWNKACQQIITSLYTTISPAGLRVRILESVPSTSTLSHDLRRRLAMCFFFSSLNYATAHSHTLMSLNSFMARLESPIFDISRDTDYRELGSYISLLDIALDDGRHIDLDLSSHSVEKVFNNGVEELNSIVKDIIRSMGSTSGAPISKVEAKEKLVSLSNRIAECIRTRPKARESLFDDIKPEEDFEKEKEGLRNFLNKSKAARNKE